jgi:signal transduction histidine kinase
VIAPLAGAARSPQLSAAAPTDRHIFTSNSQRHWTMAKPTLPEDPRVSVRREILRFAVPGVIGMVLLTLGSLLVSVAVAREQSQREAETTAQWLARTIVAPRLNAKLSGGAVEAIARLETAFASTVQGSDVVAVRLWNDDGVIIYADDPRLVGEAADPPDLSVESLISEAADPNRPENRYLSADAELVQVSLPVTGKDGSEYVFQISQQQDTIQEDARSIWVAFVPILVGSLVLLGLLLVLLGVVMARRISADLRARQDLLQQAIAASDLERRRIAADLHDGTVQDMAGLSFRLAGMSSQASARGELDNAAQLSDAADRSRACVRELRSLLVDIYPPNLEMSGLSAALSDQIAALGPEVSVDLDIADVPDLDQSTITVIYRVAREALTNVQKHARATEVSVTLRRLDGGVELRICDDGRGFDPELVEEGHMGLRVISDLVTSVGGNLTVDTAPGRGCRISFWVGSS